MKQLTLAVKQCFFHACNKSDHPQFRPEATIILQFLCCLANVTSWNIRVYFFETPGTPFEDKFSDYLKDFYKLKAPDKF